MELIKIGDFKVLIGKSINKTVHKTTFTRYKKYGLVPKTKVGAKQIRVDVSLSIEKITQYENKTQHEKQKLGIERKASKKNECLAFTLMNKLINRGNIK